ncbi:hypothetical protein [Methyloceanibacter sp.]|uniref:hypothetical protein n=1 Tax=Methyloceanibacter sp. TaxID=1965321 RepID=UPI002CB56675|nr:hypothetical protein [Methyloceanibacter sp.]HML93317.1 hypothetical protein [Methyloceanibacter sp.]
MRIRYWLLVIYAFFAGLALLAVPLSAMGWIAADPLSVVPAMLLGLPWSYGLTGLAGSQSPALNLFLVAASLAINGCLIWLAGHVLRRR